jgi:hypothetical protein
MDEDTIVLDRVDTPHHEEFMLTTIDNPYDPFTEWDSWYAFDEQMNYHTTGLLGRLALTSNELTDEENDLAIEHAVNDIFKLFPGLYKRVKKSK